MTGSVDVATDGSRVRGAATWYAFLLLGYFTYVISIQGNILPFLKAELELSYRAVSLHTSVIAVGLIVVGLLGERFCQRFGRRAAFRVGVLGSAAAMLLLCLSPVAWMSISSCALFGLFGGLIPMTVNAVLSDLHGPRRDIAFMEANAVAYAFAIMAPVISGLSVWLGLNWRGAILAGAAAGLTILIRFYRVALPEADRHAVLDAAKLPLAFWFQSIALGFAAALEFSVLLWVPAYLEQVVGLAATTSAIGASAFFVAMLVGRTGGAGLLRVLPARSILFAAWATTLLGFAAYWSTTEPAVVLAGLFVTGLGISMTFPLLMSFAMDAGHGASGRAASRLMLAPALAILLCPPLLGSLADSFGLGFAQLMTPALALLMLAAFLAGEAFLGGTASPPSTILRR